VSRPVGGVLSTAVRREPGSGWVAIHLCGLPGDIGRATRPTFGLAPGGVYRADRVTPVTGALLPHRFTLTCARRTSPSAVCSLLHFPAGRPDWPLASTLPCGAPTFLSLSPSFDHRPRPPGREVNRKNRYPGCTCKKHYIQLSNPFKLNIFELDQLLKHINKFPSKIQRKTKYHKINFTYYFCEITSINKILFVICIKNFTENI
jgi:hypothetical protein